jgi:hypothetical protein
MGGASAFRCDFALLFRVHRSEAAVAGVALVVTVFTLVVIRSHLFLLGSF